MKPVDAPARKTAFASKRPVAQTDNTTSFLHHSVGLWHDRIFELEGPKLQWCEVPGGFTTRGIGQADEVKGEMILNAESSILRTKKNPLVLLVTTDLSRLSMKFDDPTTADEWMEALKSCVAELRKAWCGKPLEPVLTYASACCLPTSWLTLPLVEKESYTHDCTIFTFEIPSGKPLALPVCACLLLRAPGCGRVTDGGKDDYDGSDAIRPYTPFIESTLMGSNFKLLVKRYDGGAVSTWLHRLVPGATVDFKHTPFNIKAQYPFEGKKSFTMICAGTGITPVYQALAKILDTEGDDRPVTLLYGNRGARDACLKEQLEAWASSKPQFKLVYIFSSAGAATDFKSKHGTVLQGCVVKELVQSHGIPPSKDTTVFVCGPPPM